MTNAMIIFTESQRLAEQGIINYTGRELVIEDAEGNKQTIKETEPIHTYNAWKELGYQVRKGEKACAQFVIWKYKAGKHNDELDIDEKGKMFMKKASFFTTSQVDLMQEVKA